MEAVPQRDRGHARTLVLSPSNELYYHRTTPLLSGVRYSMNMWFATDPTYIAGEWT